MYTQFGEVAWISDGFTLGSNVKGGLMKGLGRTSSGESLFMTTYTMSRPDGVIAFTSTMPGKILAVNTTKVNLICQEGTFLCVQTAIEVNTILIKKFTADFFGGEGLILQQIQGSGMAFLKVDGDVAEEVLAPGEVIKVDTGSVFVFESSMSYGIKTMEDVKNILSGGEGLFLIKLIGPGKVYTQTMNITEFTGQIIRGFPTSK